MIPQTAAPCSGDCAFCEAFARRLTWGGPRAIIRRILERGKQSVSDMMAHLVKCVRGMFGFTARDGIAMPFSGTARAR